MTFRIVSTEQRTSSTDTHFFFLNGPCSQWYPCEFTGTLINENVARTFNCAEQWMMANKAALFQDWTSVEAIMAVEQKRDWRDAPKRQKALGREVKNFRPEVWDEEGLDIVYLGNMHKFGQNDDLLLYLASTSPKELVEGAHYDTVWGVGLAWDDPRIADPENWQGKNKLGRTLTKVRAALACKEAETAL